jgi:amino acid transporter
VLTVAVSIASGVAAIVSAFPGLAPHREALGLLLIALITLVNLRGAKESGTVFAGPVYLFIGSMLLMLVMGAVRQLMGLGPASHVAASEIEAMQPLTAFLVLRAFASGCAALTGIEAISNGIPAFKPPESRNAAATLLWMLGICITLNVGLAHFTQYFHIRPDATGTETVLSMVGRTIFGMGPLYYLLQATTAAVLTLAANTSFADFPRLSSILARDRLAPRQLANLGDRLVFSNGILLLGVFSGILIVAFKGTTHRLIPLYAVGVFLSFTLSQLGMVVHWKRLRTPGWHLRAAVNALGAIVTGVVLVVVASVKFTHGAWIVLLVIPILILVFRKISQHYRSLAASLTLEGYRMPHTLHHQVLVLVPGTHRGVLQALVYAQSISPQCEALFVEIDPDETPKVQEKWDRLPFGIPLTVLKSPHGSLIEPITEYIRKIRAEKNVDMVTVVLPEFATTRWWHPLLHTQTGLMLKLALMNEPGVVVTNVRFRAGE